MSNVLYLLVLDPRLRKLRLALAILLFLTIVITGNIPGARSEIGHYAPGTVLHFLSYSGLALLWYTGSTGSAMARSLKAVLAIAAMGACDEFIQSFFPYRGADIRDWMVDCIAAVTTCGLLSAFLPKPMPAR
ncbi:VanZ family protein [Massilia horti]|uniref:VanZ-like domain-containing protein n=1 Tax=Massilia horti TaxID=2562153 RepID=A0A4Y9T4P5_9BURK|nr:VanZ family protein [Massilia horti]TFW34680.1 hypothetical protein E4O92_03730 [Massilia horti]